MRLLRAASQEHCPRNDDIDLWRGSEQTLEIRAFLIRDGVVRRVTCPFDLFQWAAGFLRGLMNGAEKIIGADAAGAGGLHENASALERAQPQMRELTIGVERGFDLRLILREHGRVEDDDIELTILGFHLLERFEGILVESFKFCVANIFSVLVVLNVSQGGLRGGRAKVHADDLGRAAIGGVE